MDQQYVTFFPHGDHKPDGGYTVYGPFADLAVAESHARTLSTDPDEGQVARLVTPPGDDHSASRRIDVLEREAPHLLAPPAMLEADDRHAC
jgi:hypothetical protein